MLSLIRDIYQMREQAQGEYFTNRLEMFVHSIPHAWRLKIKLEKIPSEKPQGEIRVSPDRRLIIKKVDFDISLNLKRRSMDENFYCTRLGV
ncbi:MAG: hypothetical protein ACOC23_06980 [Thermodesulfobacteriota bacterium]